MPTVGDICSYFDRFAPPKLAADWDNVGLLLGSPDADVERLLTCLTLTPEVAAEALESNVQLIVSHHPILFRGSKRLNTLAPEGKLLWPLARAGIAVYSPHTAFDNCPGGINDMIARRLGLVDVQPLRQGKTQPFKLVVFVPESDLQKVSAAMFEAGAGNIGQYSQCSFRLAGTGTFFGSDCANPTIGQKGRREEVSEWRLEVVCPGECLQAVLQAMRQAHSYETPAYDVYPLQQVAAAGDEGRIGNLTRPLSLENLARLVKEQLQAAAVQVVRGRGEPALRVAIACGAAGEFLDDARRAGADVFLTGEMRFHDFLKAQQSGIDLILPGHYASERLGIEELAERLAREWPELGVWPSRRETDPVAWV